MSSRNFRDGRGRFLNIEAHPEPVFPGDKDEPTTQLEATAVVIDALLDYYKAAPISFWRTMRRLNIILAGKDMPSPPLDDLDKFLCAHCGNGSERDGLCHECDAERQATL